MTNLKKFRNIINNLSYYKSTINKKYINYFDEIASLYLARKIEKQTTVVKLLNKLSSRGAGPKSAVKLIEKYSHYEPVVGIKVASRPETLARNAKLYNKNFHIRLNFLLRVTKLKSGFSYDEELSFGQIVAAQSAHEALKIIKDIVYEQWNFSTQYYLYEVIKIYNIKYSVQEKGQNTKVQWMTLHLAKPIKYNFIDENITHLKHKGECVKDNMLGTYTPLIKDFEIKFDKYATEIAEVVDGGYNSLQIHNICKNLDIGLYAFDISKKCFLKHVSKSRNYPTLVYYAINNHMYHVTDKEQVLSLVAKAREMQKNLSSVMLTQKEAKNVFNEIENQKEDVPIVDLFNETENTIVIYNKSNLNNELVQLMGMGIAPEIKRSHRNNISYMIVIPDKDNVNILKKDKIKYHLFADKNDKLEIDHKGIKELCVKNEIEFKNQTFPSIVRTLKDRFLNHKYERKVFTKEERLVFLNEHSSCNHCHKTLILETLEIDHIKRLADGGDNEEDNLQALCSECHFDKTQDELNTPNLSKTHSSFNKEVSEILNGPLSQHLAFCETVHKYNGEKNIRKALAEHKMNQLINNSSNINFIDELEDFLYCYNKTTKNVIAMDINKCRANLVLHNKFDFPQFTVMDNFEPYTGQTGAGDYYIETNSSLPMHGNGLYSYPIVKYCLDLNLIKPEDIKYCCIASLQIESTHFNNFIHHCRETLDEKRSKLAINSMIGSFAMDTETSLWKCLAITEDVNEAFSLFLSEKASFVDTNTSSRGRFYSVFKEINSINLETEKPIYNMIMDLEAIELHKLSQIIESNGGQVLDLKTDCIRCSFENEHPFKLIENDKTNIDGYFFDEECKVPKYKFENAKTLDIERKPRWIRDETINFKSNEWTITYDVKDNDFTPLVTKVLDVMGSCNLQAHPGCGKTTFIEKYIKPELTKRNNTYTVLTPTNISALLVNGITLDKFIAKIKTKDSLEKYATDYIIVDECSMMKEQHYKVLSIIKTFCPNSKFIIGGDFDQHQPVKDRVGDKSQAYYQNSNVLFELCNGNRLLLETCRRSDEKLHSLCENVEALSGKEFGNTFTKSHICFTNKKRILINNKMMDVIESSRKKKKENRLALNLQKLHYDSNSQNVKLFSKMPIISSKNQPIIKMGDVKVKLDMMNNEMFVIDKILDDDTIVVKNDRLKFEIPASSFQRCFMLLML